VHGWDARPTELDNHVGDDVPRFAEVLQHGLAVRAAVDFKESLTCFENAPCSRALERCVQVRGSE
jgi:hypothetical protein